MCAYTTYHKLCLLLASFAASFCPAGDKSLSRFLRSYAVLVTLLRLVEWLWAVTPEATLESSVLVSASAACATKEDKVWRLWDEASWPITPRVVEYTDPGVACLSSGVPLIGRPAPTPFWGVICDRLTLPLASSAWPSTSLFLGGCMLNTCSLELLSIALFNS